MSVVLNVLKSKLEKTNSLDIPYMALYLSSGMNKQEFEDEILRLYRSGKIAFRRTQMTTYYKLKQ